jgi:hypothetical protein
MRAIIVSSVVLILLNLNINGQNLIGCNEKEIRQYMADKEKNMSYQNFINNSTFKYLKYIDKGETETTLFFMNEQLVCKSIRVICDKSLQSEKIKEYNSIYKKSGENQWTETKNGKKYLIELKEDEWSFNVTIKLNE